ncbi:MULTISPECIES: hypothetical protein [unclassified Streptomyces]|uniref:hypothetical protein n=1 Tax=unclassified Streptomyces TaxID=2593676 RepID=UPI00278BCCC4|nr:MULTISPECIES: hypothetical protein [unclassified Streptomyces]
MEKPAEVPESRSRRIRAALRRYRAEAVRGLVSGASTATGGALVTAVVVWWRSR